MRNSGVYDLSYIFGFVRYPAGLIRHCRISGLALRENLPFRVKSNYIDRRVSGHLKAMKQLRAIGTSVLYMLVMNDPTPLHQDVGNKFFLQGLPQFTDKS